MKIDWTEMILTVMRVVLGKPFRAVTTLLLIGIVLFSIFYIPLRVSASNQILSISLSENRIEAPKISPEQIKAAALDEFTTAIISEKTANNYEIAYDGTKSKIEIGDSAKTTNFKPDLTISHWNGEVSFKLIAPVDIESKTQLTTSLDPLAKSVTATSGQWIFEYKLVEPKVGFNEFGGIDIIITAKEKPSSNKIYFTYDSSTVTPYYQPPLTDEYRDGWSDEFEYEIKVTETQVIAIADAKGVPLKEQKVLCERPDYVVGSIALYADDKSNYGIGGVNYGTGKIGSLYAMQANGQWCRWTAEGNYIVLTIPQEVIDKAVYPVVIAPVGDTFGFTTVGSSATVGSTDRILEFQYAATGSGTANSITCYNYTDTNDDGPFRFAIYDDDDSDKYLQETGDQASPSNGIPPDAAGWNTLTLNSTQPSITNGTNYWLCFWGEEYSLAWDSGSSNAYYENLSYPASMPANLTPNLLADSRNYSIYCTYTPAASFDITETTTSKALGIVAVSTTYYAKGSAPNNPVEEGDTTFILTNNAAGACDLDMKMADFTGGVGWNIEETANPAADEILITAYYVGQNPASGLLLKNADQEWYDALAGGAHIHWDFSFLTGTSFTDGAGKSGILTITAVAED